MNDPTTTDRYMIYPQIDGEPYACFELNIELKHRGWTVYNEGVPVGRVGSGNERMYSALARDFDDHSSNFTTSFHGWFPTPEAATVAVLHSKPVVDHLVYWRDYQEDEETGSD